MRRFAVAAAAAAFGIACSPNADAALTITIVQVGGDVVMTTSGTVDFSGLVQLAEDTGTLTPFIGAFNGVFTSGAEIDHSKGFYGGSGPFLKNLAAPGVNADSASGAAFGFSVGATDKPVYWVSPDYAGGELDGSATFDDVSIASLGLAAGSYTYVLPKDTITLNISAAPEPVSWAMMILGFGLVGAAMRRPAPRVRPV